MTNKLDGIDYQQWILGPVGSSHQTDNKSIVTAIGSTAQRVNADVRGDSRDRAVARLSPTCMRGASDKGHHVRRRPGGRKCTRQPRRPGEIRADRRVLAEGAQPPHRRADRGRGRKPTRLRRRRARREAVAAQEVPPSDPAIAPRPPPTRSKAVPTTAPPAAVVDPIA
jgi:hypothetical protein